MRLPRQVCEIEERDLRSQLCIISVNPMPWLLLALVLQSAFVVCYLANHGK